MYLYTPALICLEDQNEDQNAIIKYLLSGDITQKPYRASIKASILLIRPIVCGLWMLFLARIKISKDGILILILLLVNKERCM